MPIIGMLLTLKNVVMSNKYVQVALVIAAALIGIKLYGASQKNQGRKDALQDSIKEASKRAERQKEIRNEIKRLPMADRAKRLHDLSAGD